MGPVGPLPQHWRYESNEESGNGNSRPKVCRELSEGRFFAVSSDDIGVEEERAGQIARNPDETDQDRVERLGGPVPEGPGVDTLPGNCFSVVLSEPDFGRNIASAVIGHRQKRSRFFETVGNARGMDWQTNI